MSSTRPIAVFGATGAQGSAVVDAFLQAGRPVRAIARTPEKLASFAARGIETFAADVGDTESMTRALEGVDGAFVHLPLASGLYGAAVEAAGRNVARALSAAGVPLTIYTTSGPVSRTPGVSPHSDGAAAAERAVLDCGVPVVSLRPAGYLGNLSAPFSAPAVLAGELAYPLPAGFRHRWVSAQDQAALVVAALERPELAGRSFAIGHRLDGGELAAAVGRGLDRDVRYRGLTPAEFADALRPALGAAAEAIAHGYHVIVASAEELGIGDDAGEANRVLGVPLTPVEEWARAETWHAPAATAG
ncbi:MAG TPA: NmrA family NAD(P)-binding protein [Longimicrobium sp.]|nr:NmrA family NAD(P)-binding protein [Longimicrobium sp.]